VWFSSVLGIAANSAKGYTSLEPPRQDRRIEPGLLAITADDRFYYSLLSVCLSIGWRVRRARSTEVAREELRTRPMPVVVYDERLPSGNWRNDVYGVTILSERPTVLLAASQVDEDLWRLVLHCKGYDLIKRSAPCDEWSRMLRFAWLSRSTVE
jgi:hypothetical protein